ncbi:iron-siderophore ABC transporter substrate-binding protein [Pseudomonas syringae]|uniref:iron-siderophore ABC transporter substrate-binding protein n=2 Tax=Pseudomonas TaxID=286 RepID=UPI00028DD32B|nr:iron-siderophore ABC transporter substrate-binding protein [Pseudomonas syringae]EKG38148.1 ferrichrome-binding protein [Pseudomonas syringae pv. avellanae str. ISPaVe037]RMQ99370.1 Ferrichrome-binding protein [Pseudomonas savastanoi pv. glycinea]
MKRRRAVWLGCLLMLCPLLATAVESPRVVALSWEMVEHLLKLGITPVAVAEAPDYRTWVVHPELPTSVPDAGSRNEPNMDLLAQLKPDLILITPLLEDIRPQLQRIAPVVVYGDFTQAQNNRLLQRRNFLDLAWRLGRVEVAQQQLAAMDEHIAVLRRSIAERFAGHPPKVTVVRFTSPTAVFIMGPNSMPEHAMQLLGLQPAYPTPASRWGNVQVPVTELGRIEQGVVLYIEPFAQRERLFSTRLWQRMPFVEQGRVAAIRSTWTHGGIFCVENLAVAIAQGMQF